ncbi:MAG: hypothetical protein IJ064_00680 [Bacteroidaceae bacterium]|nr:hypothetical protein [Bacteroidaceae bacterium]
MDEICASIAIMYTIKRLSESGLNGNPFQDEYTVLKLHFNDLVESYDHYTSQLPSEQLQQISSLLDDILKANAKDDNMVSWIYQELKSTLAKDALKKIGSGKNKLTGNEILVQTQFFTDSYMVRYLVDETFDLCEKNLPQVVFIDPACGGGNFLTYIYTKLFNWYSAHTDNDAEVINSLILKNNIIGYDLDKKLSRIAALSLYTCSRLHSSIPNTTEVFVYGGLNDDPKGFLANHVKSNAIGGIDLSQRLASIREQEAPIVYVTNPPFMGKRDMDTSLKEYLQSYYSRSKGDLCFTFMEQIMRSMREQDIFAAVTQNGWMSLSSMKDFRRMLLDKYYLRTCIDMGPNAFENINGEKTNIVLSVITGKKPKDGLHSSFVNLRGHNMVDKRTALSKRNYEVYSVCQDNFWHNSNLEFCYQLGNDFELFKSMHRYSVLGKCMQGSSTGDNKLMVKYIWETDEEGWVLASKGGGYSKWGGLNFYKVKWGKRGELLKGNKGSALRNSSEIDNTAIVYSDTGTLGLSTRERLDGQVFIASGPGIKVLKGDPLCHLAFLNSKLATYFLKVLNPKFTVSAGYIGKIPVADGILDSPFISSLAAKCIRLKQEYLSRKLPNFEFVHVDYKAILDVDCYVEACIKEDVFNQYRRYVYEQAIDMFILDKYQLSDTQEKEYEKMTGSNMTYTGDLLNMRKIDKMLASTMNGCCQSVSRKLNGYIIGTENCIDMISYMYSLRPKDIARYLIENVSSLSITKRLYKRDLIHKLILQTSGIYSLSHVQPVLSLTVDDIHAQLMENYPELYRLLQITPETIREIISVVHQKCFFNHPILKL